MKVYVVTAGEYSDYRIKAIFSTKANALDYRESAKVIDGEINNEIDEYTLDTVRDYWYTTFVRMKQDGTATMVETELGDDNGFKFFTRPGFGDVELGWNVVTNDKERAVKVVNEKRSQIIALGIWGNGEEVKLRCV